MISVSHLTKSYGKRTVVDDLSFDLAAGRITGFVGPNGAGKSTTMRMMVGLARPDAGTVRFGGSSYSDLRDPARTVGVVLDARAMHPGRSARNHLRSMTAISSLPEARVDSVLNRVGLDTAANQRVGGFSLGMRQRLAIAGALLGDPEVLMLDEPANGLDPNGIRWLRTMLTDFANAGGTVFVSSHFIAELATFAHELVVVGNGRLITAEPLAETLDRDRSLSLEDILLDLTGDATSYAAA
jgi:ABC-2 type transport system ATP-binding protein